MQLRSCPAHDCGLQDGKIQFVEFLAVFNGRKYEEATRDDMADLVDSCAFNPVVGLLCINLELSRGIFDPVSGWKVP